MRGQLFIQTKAVERFLHRQYKYPQTLCHPTTNFAINLSPLPVNLTEAQGQIYCSLSASTQELLKITPVLDCLLSRRGELALVRQLPLVKGERQSDPVLSIAPVEFPNLGKPAIPFSAREPNLTSAPLPMIGRNVKKALANYVPPMQPAIAAPPEALITLDAAFKFLKVAKSAFPPEYKFLDSQETAAILDRFAYDIDSQEPQTYAKLLALPNTGIFRVLPNSVYLRPLNTLQNQLQPSVSQRYPFPSLDEASQGFNPSLALQTVNENFQFMHSGIDYSLMVDVGDVPLDKVELSTPEFLLNYQPPQQLEALQVDRRRFLTGKDQNWQQSQVYLDSAKAVLNHTYLVRTLQFQLPEMILNRQPISPHHSRARQQLAEMKSSDIILAFRPVRRRNDGSYTVIWRVLKKLPAPSIEDLDKYIPY